LICSCVINAVIEAELVCREPAYRGGKIYVQRGGTSPTEAHNGRVTWRFSRGLNLPDLPRPTTRKSKQMVVLDKCQSRDSMVVVQDDSVLELANV